MKIFNMNTYGLIGYFLAHSFSRSYFTTKFRQQGNTNCEYLNFPLANLDEFEDLIRSQKTLKGLNVTLPYKVEIKDKLHCLSPQAQEIGAVNVIEFLQDGKLKGHNTDCIGFEKTFMPLLEKKQYKALILGKGGAALAVEYVLNKHHIPYTYVSRNPKESDFGYTQLSAEVIQEYQIIINTSPLGMSTQTETFPDIPYSLLGPQHICYDLVYLPPPAGITTFLKKCQAQGAIVKDGLEMLILQAEASWDIWNA